MLHYYELDKKQISEAFKYYSFIQWLVEEGWEPYVYDEQYVNLGLPGNPVVTVDFLWTEYNHENKPKEI